MSGVLPDVTTDAPPDTEALEPIPFLSRYLRLKPPKPSPPPLSRLLSSSLAIRSIRSLVSLPRFITRKPTATGAPTLHVAPDPANDRSTRNASAGSTANLAVVHRASVVTVTGTRGGTANATRRSLSPLPALLALPSTPDSFSSLFLPPTTAVTATGLMYPLVFKFSPASICKTVATDSLGFSTSGSDGAVPGAYPHRTDVDMSNTALGPASIDVLCTCDPDGDEYPSSASNTCPARPAPPPPLDVGDCDFEGETLPCCCLTTASASTATVDGSQGRECPGWMARLVTVTTSSCRLECDTTTLTSVAPLAARAAPTSRTVMISGSTRVRRS
mmetsp:Transcript_29001/g.58858  ORF Transcript_29001/g.58858 Transcript_29001/m.58858 type:complete len:331 (+) Transcript_29001:786-1778(+)